MSASACSACRRRAWLLAELSGVLERVAGDPGRLLDTLALDDRELILALAGRRCDELLACLEQLPADAADGPALTAICRHDPAWPRALRDAPWAPRLLHVEGDVARLVELARAPTAAIVGSQAASDYGMEAARGLARGLAASGVTVAAGVADGVAHAALCGAVQAGSAIAAAGDGPGVAWAPRRRGLHARVLARGCVACELPHGCRGRRWGGLAGARVPVALASVVIVVEAGDGAAALLQARMAQRLGRTVAAVPGRVGARLSRGPHSLIREGAHLLRDARDALELLPPSPADGPTLVATASAGLHPSLRRVLELVGDGHDTQGRVAAAAGDAGAALAALGELELMGLLARGDGGRYVVAGFAGSGDKRP